VVKKSRTIIKFIKRRHMPLAVFRKHEEKLSLVMSGKTRFGLNFLMVDQLLQVRTTLEQSVMDPQWMGYVSKPRDSRTVKARTVSKKVKEYVLNEYFWERCTNFRGDVAPVMWALWDFDGKDPCMGTILHSFLNLEKHVVSLRGIPFRLDHDMADPMEDAFYNYWTMVKTNLHYGGALLNPYLLHDKELADDNDSLIVCKRVLQKLCSPEMYPDVVQDFLAFRHKQGLFHDMLDPKDQKCSPHDWWAFDGACGKLIAPIARKILGQTVSSSSCEQNWSNYSFVHNKYRNRLQPKRVEDLVYVYTNSRLMAEGKEKDEKKWYVDNVNSEDSDFVPEEEFKDHGDLDLDGMDDGNLGVRGSYRGTNRSPYSPRRDRTLDLKDEYSFREEEDEHLRDTPSIAAFVNGDGLLNNDNVLRKSSIVEDVESVLAVKANDVNEIGTKEEMSPAHSLSRKGHASGSGKDGEAAKKTIVDALLTVCNAYAKEESDVEKLDPISSTGIKLGEGSSSGRGQQSSMSDCPSRALFWEQ
jgi:hypothetical protein